MKLVTKALLLTALTGSAAVEAAPPCHTLQCKPKVRGDEDHLVTGSRIRSFGQGDTPAELHSLAAKAGAAGGGAPTGSSNPTEVNESGQKKAEKAKQESESGVSTWWRNSVLGFFTRMKATVTVEGKVRYVDENGNERVNIEGCVRTAINTENKNACTKIETFPTQDGKLHMRIHKLIAVKYGNSYKLVYSTNDSINLIVDDVDEAVNLLAEVDPRIQP
jgi:hypothetical protein